MHDVELNKDKQPELYEAAKKLQPEGSQASSLQAIAFISFA